MGCAGRENFRRPNRPAAILAKAHSAPVSHATQPNKIQCASNCAAIFRLPALAAVPVETWDADCKPGVGEAKVLGASSTANEIWLPDSAAVETAQTGFCHTGEFRNGRQGKLATA